MCTNKKVDGLIPSSSSQLVKVSLDMILNLEFPPMHLCECAEKCLVACMNEYMKFKVKKGINRSVFYSTRVEKYHISTSPKLADMFAKDHKCSCVNVLMQRV